MTSATFSCEITLLSPVHIGCDQDYEPTGFVLDEQAGQMIAFDPSLFLARLEKRDLHQFSELCKKGTVESLLEIYRFMRQHRDIVTDSDPGGYNSIAVSQDFIDHYRKTLGRQKPLNRFMVARTAYEKLTGNPYLPGTALKGAMRTAVLNRRNNGKSRPFMRDGKELNRQLLGGEFATDPFRLVKVSDFHALHPVRQRIVYAVNRKKKPSEREASGPYQILEVIEAGARFFGAITIQEPPGRDSISRPVSMEEIIHSLSFYLNEITNEHKILRTIGCPLVQIPDSSAKPVRIGRHSGSECVTVAGRRNIRVKVGRREYKNLDHATTLWLAADSQRPATNSSLRPFGWAAFALLPEEEADRLRQEKKQLFEQWEQTGRIVLTAHRKRQEILTREREQARLSEQRAAEEKRRQAEEQKKYPWRQILRRTEQVKSWGELKTKMLENETLTRYQSEPEVGQAVYDTASAIIDALSQKKRKTWPEERDQILVHWLEPAGITWEGAWTAQAAQSVEPATDPDLYSHIRELQDWQEWKRSKINIRQLDLAAAKVLKEKFQQWKLKKQGDKNQKKALKDLAKRIKKLEAS